MRIILLLLFIVILWLNRPIVHGATTTEFQAQISALLWQVQVLQARLQTTQSLTPLVKEPVVLTLTLRREATDATISGKVSRLQQFLAQDKAIYPGGLVTG